SIITFRRGASSAPLTPGFNRSPRRPFPRPETYSLHFRVRTFAMFGDEAVDPRGENGQRYRAELEHCIVERADVEFRSERFLRLLAGTHNRELAANHRETHAS